MGFIQKCVRRPLTLSNLNACISELGPSNVILGPSSETAGHSKSNEYTSE